ncbi:MAG TPA: SpoIVB peptidase [Epulopiscium sp.]|nr:SpoIVB peptidase [Candidatus Epulonipiscium sp.]
MIKKKKKRIFHISVGLLCVLTIISPFVVLHYCLPHSIHLIEGQEHTFEFAIPFEAKLTPERVGVLKINNKPIEDANIKVNLKEPFTMQVDDLGNVDVQLSLLGFIPVTTMKVEVMPHTQVIPCGKTVGVKISTDGIMVLGLGAVKGEDENSYEPGRDIFEMGDLIQEVDNQKLDSKEDLIACVTQSEGIPLKMKIRRGKSIIRKTITPVYCKEEKAYKIGVWVRDSTQGIGTITYYNPETKTYGALGHGITDVDTKQIMSVRGGELVKTEISSIKKGKRGTPGELSGIIYNNEESIIGNIQKNTEQGIYGTLYEPGLEILQGEPVYLAFQNEVEEGPAYIFANISGEEVEKFQVDIQKVSKYNNDISKGMVVKIVDTRLIDATNGIVQGMSGSPIIQNNKLIGAITHVFVQDPTKGYGIFIENMIQKEKEVN